MATQSTRLAVLADEDGNILGTARAEGGEGDAPSAMGLIPGRDQVLEEIEVDAETAKLDGDALHRAVGERYLKRRRTSK